MKKITAVLMCLMMLFPHTIVNAAQTASPEITDYTVKDNVNMDISRIQMGDSVNLSINIKDNSVTAKEVTAPEDINIVSMEGSFGTVDPDSIVINSSGTSQLEYTVNFKDVVYSGMGNAVTFKVRYPKLNLTSDTVTARIYECSEEEAGTPETLSGGVPYIEITRGEIKEPIEAGQDFDLLLIVKNRGSVEITKPYVTISLPTSLASRESVGNIKLPDIKPGGSARFTLKLKGEKYIETSSEDIDVVINYNYSVDQTGSYSDKIMIPMKADRATSAPIVQVSRGELSEPLQADSEFLLPVSIKNVGETEILSPLISFTVSEELIFMEDNTSKILEPLKSGEKTDMVLKLKTKKQLTQPTQEISTELKYNYKSGSETMQSTDSSKLIIPVQPNLEEVAAPILRIVPEDIPSPIKSKTSFTTAVNIENVGTNAIKNALLSWETDDGIMLMGNTSSANVGTLAPGESKRVTLNVRTLDKLTGTSHSISGELKYNYDNGKTAEKGSETVKIVIPTIPDKEEEEDKKTKKATPNIITDSYSYGGVPVANGEKFEFNTVFKNTSNNIPLENIVMTVETGEGVTITSASNTYYYESMAAMGKNSCTIPMQVLPTAEKNSVQINISFKYEYLDNGERNQVTSEQNVSVPIYKPDKLDISMDPLMPAVAGQEQTVTLNYVNKGKGQLSNVKAEVEGGVTALTAVQNLGNFESGKSGSINFVVIPDMPGEAQFKITVSYEDANMEQKTLEFPCVMQVEEMSEDVGYFEEDMPLEEEQGLSFGKKLLIGIGSGIGGIIIIIIIINIIRKKRKAKNAVKVDWEA